MSLRRPRLSVSRPAVLRSSPVLLPLLCLLSALPLGAQSLQVGDPLEEYLRVVQLAGSPWEGSFTVRPFRGVSGDGIEGGTDPWSIASRLPGMELRPSGLRTGDVQARIFTSYNAALPNGRNDGVIWQGKGLNAAVQGGGSFGWGPVTVTLRPIVAWAQNGEFDLGDPTGARTGDDVYAYPWRDPDTGQLRIDLPQRFGPDAFTRIDPGESSIRVDLGPVTVGAGTEDLWWGPGVRNALVLSSEAGGFPHLDLGTDGAVDIGIGRLEAQWIWGRLTHSDVWDPAIEDRNRFFTGAVVALTPDFAPGLTLGATRGFARLIPEEGLDAGDFLQVLQPGTKAGFVTDDNPTGEDESDQLASLFARWAFPDAGVEAWAEWGRNDHSWDLRDLAVQLGHSQAWTLGLRRVAELSGESLLSITGELTHLETSSSQQVREVLPWYTHFLVRQGWTHEGQLLGAAVGPGGNSQFLGVDLWHDGGRWGGWIERRVNAVDFFYPQVDFGEWDRAHVSIDAGARALWLTPWGEVGARVGVVRELNRYFIARNDLWNPTFGLSASWRLR